MRSKKKRNRFRWWGAALSFTAGTVFLYYSGNAASAVKKGIELCGNSVIPSLFPMLFISQYMINSGAAELVGTFLDRPTRFLFGLPGVCGVAILNAFVGGYPAGARAAVSLTESGRITRDEGERLANMAFCSGPGFSIGMIGASLYHSKAAGLLILTAQVFSCIMIGAAYRAKAGSDCGSGNFSFKDGMNLTDGKDALVRSVTDTAAVLLNMCSFIVLFQVILSMLDTVGVNSLLGCLTKKVGLGDMGKWLLPCVTEVTAGSMISVRFGLPFTAFVVGFGGLSVQFQNFAVCRSLHLCKSSYIITRLMQGTLCGITVFFALNLPFFSSVVLPASNVVVGGLPTGFSAVSAGYGCTMLVMCLMSVFCLPHNPKECNVK